MLITLQVLPMLKGVSHWGPAQDSACHPVKDTDSRGETGWRTANRRPLAQELEVWPLAPGVSAGAIQDTQVPFSLGFVLGPPESQHQPPLYFACYGKGPK